MWQGLPWAFSEQDRTRAYSHEVYTPEGRWQGFGDSLTVLSRGEM